MGFANFCRKISILLILSELVWAMFIFPYHIYSSIGILVTISTGIISILIYGLGEIVSNLNYIRTMMVEQQEFREESYKEQSTNEEE